jgi:hypothetical protein
LTFELVNLGLRVDRTMPLQLTLHYAIYEDGQCA